MSTMKIVTPKGAIRVVDKVVPVVEKRFKFNGKVRRLTETAKDLSVEPTALAFHYADNAIGIGCNYDVELFIGNLSFQKVAEIQQSLVKEGFFDFSGLEYQKVCRVEKTVFDEGASKPYTSDYVFGMIGNFTNNLFGGGYNNMDCSPMGLNGDIFAQDDADYDEEGDDCCDEDIEEGED